MHYLFRSCKADGAIKYFRNSIMRAEAEIEIDQWATSKLAIACHLIDNVPMTSVPTTQIPAVMTANTIVLYDGVCGLCNRLTQFLLKRDKHDRLNFASLQSEFSNKLLKRHGLDPQDLDTVYVVLDPLKPTERVLARSDAILHLGGELGGVWSLSRAGRVLPKFFRDRIYDLVARNRYRVFGKHETCVLPEPQHRKKFIDV